MDYLQEIQLLSELEIATRIEKLTEQRSIWTNARVVADIDKELTELRNRLKDLQQKKP